MYQWHKDGKAIPGRAAQQPKLVIEGVAVSDSGRYHVTVTNTGGTTQSIHAIVSVRPRPSNLLSSVPSSAAALAGRGRRARAAHRRGASVPAGVLDSLQLGGGAPSPSTASTSQRHSAVELGSAERAAEQPPLPSDSATALHDTAPAANGPLVPEAVATGGNERAMEPVQEVEEDLDAAALGRDGQEQGAGHDAPA